MILMILFLLTIGLLATCFNRKIEEIIPVMVFSTMILVYLSAIIGKISLVFWIVAGAYLLTGLAALGWMVFCAQGKNPGVIGKEFIKRYVSPGFFLYIILAGIVVYAFHTHFITNWDDLNYWAMFPKNIYEINEVPTGRYNCTIFRDYSPMIQFTYYLGFQTIGRFSEPLMFQVNNILLYTAMLPFFTPKEKERKSFYVLKVAVGILFPYVAMFQQLHCLGVDCIMGLMFGYIIYTVFDRSRQDLFYYIRILVAMIVLTLTKSSGIIFVLIAMVVYIIVGYKEKKRTWISAGMLFTPVILSYFSWKVYCNRRGNTSYLHQRVFANLDLEKFIQFPDYGKQVVRDFFVSFVNFPLNSGRFGFSPLVILLLIIGLFLLLRWAKKIQKREWAVFITLLVGFFIYCIFLLYMYLFVFEQWEALSLSSYDRYMAIYVVGMLYIVVIFLSGAVEKCREKYGTYANPYILLIIIFVATLNYPMLYTHLIPDRYNSKYAEDYQRKNEIAAEFEKLQTNTLEPGQEMIIINKKFTTGDEKYAQYAAVPAVTDKFSLEDHDIKTVKDDLLSRLTDRHTYYVYFMEGNYSKEYLNILNNMCDGFEIQSGHIYHFIEESRMLEEVVR